MTFSAFVDLRSDTVTRPSDAMRHAMAMAPVGDDVMGEDPTVNELEAYTADLLGMEAALFVASGTQANQIAVRVYGGPGSEILAVDESHLFFYEAGSAAGLSGVQIYPVPVQNGIFDPVDFTLRTRPDDPHFPITRLFWVENTHNRGGGRIVPLDLMHRLKTLSDASGIPVHVDGARLANAAMATGILLKQWSETCHSLSLCLSKGLGAPVGSVLAGSKEFIEGARRARKAFGGGMRQAGIIAAGALFALKHNVERLVLDHERAARIAAAVQDIPGLSTSGPTDTNIVMIDIDPETGKTGGQVQNDLEEFGIKLYAVGPQRVRVVTHLDIDDTGIEKAIAAFRTLFH